MNEANERKAKGERQLITRENSGQLETVERGCVPRVGQTHAQRCRAGQRRCRGTGWQDRGALRRDESRSQEADRTVGRQDARAPYRARAKPDRAKPGGGELARERASALNRTGLLVASQTDLEEKGKSPDGESY